MKLRVAKMAKRVAIGMLANRAERSAEIEALGKDVV